MGLKPRADEVWRKLLEEVSMGTLIGPISFDEVDASWLLSRRFGLLQGQKLRCIADFTRSAVNCCVQTCESPKPHKVDVFGALCIQVMSILG